MQHWDSARHTTLNLRHHCRKREFACVSQATWEVQRNSNSSKMAVPMINIQREACKQDDLLSEFRKDEEDVPLAETLSKAVRKNVRCSGKCLKRKALETFPFINMLRRYRIKRNIFYDLMAGLNVGIIHIPQSMGFALLSSLPPVYGLYCSFFQPLIYFFFSASQHNSLGTMAVPSLIIGAAVERELNIILEKRGIVLPTANQSLSELNRTANGTDFPGDLGFDIEMEKVAIATTLTLLVGVIQLAMAVFRLGAMTTFMPVSFVGGFTTACGFYITASQLPALFGIEVSRHAGMFRLIKLLMDFFSNIQKTNLATLTISAICVPILIILKEVINEKYKKKLKIPIPADLLVVILGTVISYYARLNERYGVQDVGNIPNGLPIPAVPPLESAGDLFTDAIVLAILSFVISIAMANIFAKKYRYHVDPNQEMLAYGAMHTASSFFHCFGGACAPPRSYVFDKSGGRSSVAYLFSCVLLLVVIMSIGYLFKPLPKAVLASVIIIALFPLFRQFKDLALYWRISKFDFLIWFVSWLATILTDIGIGAGIGVGYVVIAYIFQSLFAKGHVMGVLNTDDIIVPEKSYNRVQRMSGVVIFQFEANLYFATVQRFKDQLFKATFNPGLLVDSYSDKTADRRAVIREQTNASTEQIHDKCDKVDDYISDIQHIVIDCSRFSFIDVMAISTLQQIGESFLAVGVQICLINCSSSFRARLEKVNLLRAKYAPFVEYPTIHDALAYLRHSANNNDSDV